MGGSLSGSFEIDTGDILASSGGFTLAFVEDLTTEGSEGFVVNIRTSPGGTIVETIEGMSITDTSLTPPVFSASVSVSSVPEGGEFTLSAIADWFLGDTLYITRTGTAGDADFVGGLPESLSLSETTYPRKTGSVVITVAQDALIEGPENITFELRTGSAGGPVVATAGPVTLIDEAYTVTVSRTTVKGGQAVEIEFRAINASPSATHGYLITGTVVAGDFTDDALSGTFSLVDGVATVTKTLDAEAAAEGALFFRVQMRRTDAEGAVLATSVAVMVYSAVEDYDAFLASSEGIRVLLMEMDHADGTEYFADYPYVSLPGDSDPHRGYDPALLEAVNFESRIDGHFQAGRIAVANNHGDYDHLLDLAWRGYEIRLYLGAPGWSRDDFRLIARQIKSYKQLPITVFQIQTKFRNEERPRFGVMRTSEFQMKDAYSFGTNLEQLNHAYEQMYHAYRRIFSRCGLDYRPVEAESGPIGGDASHEFMVPAANGEDEIVHCNSCDYAANTERAETGRPAPEIAAPAQMAELDSVETPDAGSIEQVCRMLGCEPQRMIKTLIYQADEQTVAVLVRGDHEANEAKIRRALGADSVELADPKTIIEVTGAPVGFAGPVGLSCPLLADHDVVEIVDAVTGANQKDTHLSGVNIVRDYSLETSYDLRMATAQDPCPRCDGSLELARGIEVGHVFKLGTKYSTALSALYLDENEVKHPMLMGCYGIGINRIVAATAETSHDENGLIWPLSIAPYQVLLIPLNIDDQEVMAAAESIYQQLDQQLGSQGVDVLMDDRKARPGFKFKDADLVGIPLKIIVGGKGLADGVVELKWRTDHEARRIPLEDIVATIGEEIAARVAVEAEAVPE